MNKKAQMFQDMEVAILGEGDRAQDIADLLEDNGALSTSYEDFTEIVEASERDGVDILICLEEAIDGDSVLEAIKSFRLSSHAPKVAWTIGSNPVAYTDGALELSKDNQQKVLRAIYCSVLVHKDLYGNKSS